MNENDINKIVEAFNSSKFKESEKNRIIDWLFKALIAVIVWIGIGLRNDVEILKQDVNKITTQRTYSERDMDNFREFIKTPRFTKEDDDVALYPVKQDVIRNTLELKTRSSFFQEIEKRLLKLEFDLKQLKEEE